MLVISKLNYHFLVSTCPLNMKSPQKTSLILGLILVAAVLSIHLFRLNRPEDLSKILKILFALGCGGLSAAFIGYLRIIKRGKIVISAGGGFAVFLIVLFVWLKWESPVPSPVFNTTVYLKNSNGELIADTGITLSFPMMVGRKFGELIPRSKGYLFNSISSEYLNKETEFAIQSFYWCFDSNKVTNAVKIIDGNVNVHVVRNPASLMLRGSINDGDPTFANASIVLAGVMRRYSVDANGFFIIGLPEETMADHIDAVIRLSGYKDMKATLVPGSFKQLPALSRSSGSGITLPEIKIIKDPAPPPTKKEVNVKLEEDKEANIKTYAAKPVDISERGNVYFSVAIGNNYNGGTIVKFINEEKNLANGFVNRLLLGRGGDLIGKTIQVITDVTNINEINKTIPVIDQFNDGEPAKVQLTGTLTPKGKLFSFVRTYTFRKNAQAVYTLKYNNGAQIPYYLTDNPNENPAGFLDNDTDLKMVFALNDNSPVIQFSFFDKRKNMQQQGWIYVKNLDKNKTN